jgi:hypothetical protein
MSFFMAALSPLPLTCRHFYGAGAKQVESGTSFCYAMNYQHHHRGGMYDPHTRIIAVVRSGVNPSAVPVSPPGSDTGTLEFRYRARTTCWIDDRDGLSGADCGLCQTGHAGADVAWYGLRAWIERGFKDSKRGGWHWEQTKMLDPPRAKWLWLAISVATLWTVAVGCAADAAAEQSPLIRLVGGTPQKTSRALSCFRRGRLLMVVALCQCLHVRGGEGGEGGEGNPEKGRCHGPA